MDLYEMLGSLERADPAIRGRGLRTEETKAVETRDGDMQATLLSVEAP